MPTERNKQSEGGAQVESPSRPATPAPADKISLEEEIDVWKEMFERQGERYESELSSLRSRLAEAEKERETWLEEVPDAFGRMGFIAGTKELVRQFAGACEQLHKEAQLACDLRVQQDAVIERCAQSIQEKYPEAAAILRQHGDGISGEDWGELNREMEQMRSYIQTQQVKVRMAQDAQCELEQQLEAMRTALQEEKSRSERLQQFWDAQSEWSQATFGTDAVRGPIGPLKHLAKEAQEAQDKPTDIMEFVDCLFLTFDASRRAGFTLEQLTDAAFRKLEINKARIWPKTTDMNAAVEHIQAALEEKPL